MEHHKTKLNTVADYDEPKWPTVDNDRPYLYVFAESQDEWFTVSRR